MRNKSLTLASLLIGFICISGMCSKDDAGAGNSNNSSNNGNGNNITPPDATKAYVIINVRKSALFPETNDYEFLSVPQTSGNMAVRIAGGDTVRCFWLFTASRLSTVTLPIQWDFCNGASWQTGGSDQYAVSFEWPKSINGTSLVQGKTYKLNYLFTPLADTKGVVYFSHYKNNTLIASLNTLEAVVENSSLTIDKIEGNTASGSFKFSFFCFFTGTANSKQTSVMGKFNKIPIQ